MCMREGFIRSFVMFLIIILGFRPSPPKQAPAGRVYFFLLSLSIEFYDFESVTGHSIRKVEIGRYAYLHAWSLFFGDGSAALLYSI